MKKKYYALTQIGRAADIYIFGDITSWEWAESDVSSYTLSKELDGLDVDEINVHINSYGGEVAEGLTIYNLLRNHKAKIKTYCDGFACSIASVIFMAGDERIMSEASMLMIHNAWMYTGGNASQLRKDADDLDKITQASVAAYMSRISIDEAKLKTLLDNESWLLPGESLEMGFATSIKADEKSDKAAASARKALFCLAKTGINAGSKAPTAPSEPPTPQVPPAPPTPPTEPQENKLQKLFSALVKGGKETE